MADWIFQANPKRYDVHAAVARSPQDWWNTPRYRDRIALNDRVWLQIVGQDRPGIYYLATIVSLPYESPEEEFGPWHTDIRWDYRIDPPLARPELVNDAALQSFWAFRGFQGSNVPVPAEIASRLMELARPRLVGLDSEQHPGVSEELEVSAAIERHNTAVRQKLRQAIIALERYPDGTVIIRNADGFDLALHPVEHIEPPPAFLHAGFRAAGPADVRALMDRMEADGITIAERNDEAAYVGFKCLDPDGHRIEVYWEPPLSGNAESGGGPQ